MGIHGCRIVCAVTIKLEIGQHSSVYGSSTNPMEIPHPTVLMVKVGGNISSPSPTVVLLLMEELPAPPGDANLNSWNYL